MPIHKFDNLIFTDVSPGEEIPGMIYLGNSRYGVEVSPEEEKRLEEIGSRARTAAKERLEMFGSKNYERGSIKRDSRGGIIKPGDTT